MNLLLDIVPPNMDEVCQVQYEYIDIVPPPHSNQTNADYLLSTTTRTCSNPLNYYAGYGMDLLFIGIFITISIVVLIKAGRPVKEYK